jgi:hypothetical protein
MICYNIIVPEFFTEATQRRHPRGAGILPEGILSERVKMIEAVNFPGLR